MAITLLEQNTVQQGCTAAKQLLATLKPVLDQLNVIYDGSGGVKSTLTDAKLAEVPAFSGLTKSQCDDGFFALTSTIKGDLTSAFSQLAIIAARG